MILQGAVTALATPFKEGRLDEESLGRLIEYQISQGIDGLAPCGTTGESATLSHEEHMRVVEFTVRAAAKKVPVIAGAGSNNTSEAIALTLHAKKAGADAALHITPYYNKPTQEGLFRHFAAIAQATDFPLIVYNIQGRTAVNITPDTMARIARLPQVAGIKEASGDVVQMAAMRKLCDPRVVLFSGDDSLTLPVLAIGGCGVISVLSNLMPGQVAGMCRLWRQGKQAEALESYYYLFDLARDLFLETNPILIKKALKLKGLIDSDEVRLPLCQPQDSTLARFRATFDAYNLL